MQEFQRTRAFIYMLQDQLDLERRNMEKIRSKMEILHQEFQQYMGSSQRIMTQLQTHFQGMAQIQKKQPTVKVYTDMSQDKEQMAYGGLIVENGAMTPVAGRLEPNSFQQRVTVGETMALITVTEWAAQQWPEAILQIHSDSDDCIRVFENYIRFPRRGSTDTYLNFLQTRIEQQLGSHLGRIFPRWIPRSTPEISLCDALARRRLGTVPPRIPWVKMLRLAQGQVKGTWTPAAVQILHSYHRACRRGWRLEEGGFTGRPPTEPLLEDVVPEKENEPASEAPG